MVLLSVPSSDETEDLDLAGEESVQEEDVGSAVSVVIADVIASESTILLLDPRTLDLTVNTERPC